MVQFLFLFVWVSLTMGDVQSKWQRHGLFWHRVTILMCLIPFGICSQNLDVVIFLFSLISDEFKVTNYVQACLKICYFSVPHPYHFSSWEASVMGRACNRQCEICHKYSHIVRHDKYS